MFNSNVRLLPETGFWWGFLTIDLVSVALSRAGGDWREMIVLVTTQFVMASRPSVAFGAIACFLGLCLAGYCRLGGNHNQIVGGSPTNLLGPY